MTRLAYLALLAATLPACASFGDVQPWQKGDLARPEMQFDAGSLDARNAASVYSSREAARAGSAWAAAARGCN
jgi:hypothetical protein